jgi:hypothetical protein
LKIFKWILSFERLNYLTFRGSKSKLRGALRCLIGRPWQKQKLLETPQLGSDRGP